MSLGSERDDVTSVASVRFVVMILPRVFGRVMKRRDASAKLSAPVRLAEMVLLTVFEIVTTEETTIERAALIALPIEIDPAAVMEIITPRPR
jgi:hypothetical protein